MKRLSISPLARNGLLTGLLLLMGAVAGCGSGSDASTASSPPVSNDPPPPVVNPPAPAPVEGVATPSSVAVVTATNAQ